MGGIYDLNGNLLQLPDGITPEKYGAVGDGLTDDTTAIQSALSEAATKNETVVFGYGKTYAVSSTLNITKRNTIHGNGSIIKAISSMSDVLHIKTETEHVPTSIGRGVLQNLTIDGNKLASNGIYVEHATGYNMQDIDVLRFLSHGIHIASGFEIFCNNIRFSTGLGNISAIGTVGLYMDTYDSHFSNIVPINTELGVVDKKGGNFYYGVHGWNTNAEIMPTSVLFDVYGPVWATNCYVDCCAIGFRINGDYPINAYGLKILGSTKFMPSSVMGNVTPKVFELASSANTARIKAYGIVFSANLSYLFSNRAASAWTGFDWRTNNDTSITNLGECPQ